MTATWFDSSRLPTAWKTLPLRRVGRIVNGGTPTTDPENWDGQYPFVTPPDLNGADGAVIESTARTLSSTGIRAAGIAPAGSILVSTRAPIGHIGRVGTLSTFNQGCKAVTPNLGIDPGYIATVLVAARAELIARGQGTTFFELSSAAFAAVTIPLPPLDEQRAIADYLDQETAQIDTLVAKQEEFIRLLRERRGAVQDRLLLSSDAPLVPLRHITEQITVGIVVQPAQWYVDEGILALRGTNIKPERIDLADLVYLSNEGHARHFKSHLRAGDVVVVRTGQSGTAAVVPPELSGANAIDLLLVRPNRRLMGEYLAMVLNAPGMREISNQEIVGTIQGHLNVAALRGVNIPVPEISDQRALVSEWRSASISIDALIAKAEEHIALAKERRSALITAAVTGQFDVRTAKKGARV